MDKNVSKDQTMGLDIGTSTVKAVMADQKIIMPSVYCKRFVKSVWDEKYKAESLVIEGAARKAIDIAKHENAILIHPIMEGQIRHDVDVELVQEVYKRLNVKNSGDVVLVTGLPYDASIHDINNLEKLLTKTLGEHREIIIYPQGFGTLMDVGLDSATIIDIGHSTTGLLIVENLTVLGGGTEPKATDYAISQVRNHIIKNYELISDPETVRDLIVCKEVNVGDTIVCNYINAISDGYTNVTREAVDSVIMDAVNFLCEKIAHDVMEMHAHLPTMNLGCVQNIVLSGGFSKLQNPHTKEYIIKDTLEKKLKRTVICPEDAMFSETNGFYKLAVELGQSLE
jgi:actin-like ATPase involved in cell morphogenesis